MELGKHAFLDSIGRIDARDVDDGEALVVVGDLDEDALEKTRFAPV
jgi:hypothetical protein